MGQNQTQGLRAQQRRRFRSGEGFSSAGNEPVREAGGNTGFPCVLGVQGQSRVGTWSTGPSEAIARLSGGCGKAPVMGRSWGCCVPSKWEPPLADATHSPYKTPKEPTAVPQTGCSKPRINPVRVRLAPTSTKEAGSQQAGPPAGPSSTGPHPKLCSSLGFKSPQVLRLSPGVGVFSPRRPNSSGTFRSS